MSDIQARIAAVESMTQMVRSMPQSASTELQLGMLDAQMKTLQDELKEAALSRKDPKAYEPQPNPKKAALSRKQVIKMTEEANGDTTEQWANSSMVASLVAAAWKKQKCDPASCVAGGCVASSASEESDHASSLAPAATKQKSRDVSEKKQAKRARQWGAKELAKLDSSSPASEDKATKDVTNGSQVTYTGVLGAKVRALGDAPSVDPASGMAGGVYRLLTNDSVAVCLVQKRKRWSRTSRVLPSATGGRSRTRRRTAPSLARTNPMVGCGAATAACAAIRTYFGAHSCSSRATPTGRASCGAAAWSAAA